MSTGDFAGIHFSNEIVRHNFENIFLGYAMAEIESQQIRGQANQPKKV